VGSEMCIRDSFQSVVELVKPELEANSIAY
jgi:hypothetical protein